MLYTAWCCIQLGVVYSLVLHDDAMYGRLFKCRLKSVILGMACHETVSCPRCERTFECRVGTILRCQCQDVVLTEEERYFIQQHYSGCLCADCLREMQAIYRQPEATS